jgi:hypothetical protein
MSGAAVQTDPVPRWHHRAVWAGRIISVAPVFIVLMSSRLRRTIPGGSRGRPIVVGVERRAQSFDEVVEPMLGQQRIHRA